MKKPKLFSKSNDNYYVPKVVQQFFTYLIIGTFLAQSIFFMITTVTQMGAGSDFGPQLGYLLIYNLLPVIAFLIAYFMNPRKLSMLPRAFEALLITIAATMLWSLVNLMIPMLIFRNSAYDNYQIFEYISSATFLTLFTATLYMIRKKGLWSA